MPDTTHDLGQMIHVALGDDRATQQLGQDIAAIVKKGLCLHLVGELGAGKTTLARSMLRSLCAAPELDVPSPTYTLIETYEALAFPCTHADLYRLSAPDEVADLGLEEALEDGLLLIEWPQKGGQLTPKADIRITLSGEGPRQAVIEGDGAFVTQMKRSLAIRSFLEASGWSNAWRRPLKGDASQRAYEEIVLAEPARTAVLMNAPQSDVSGCDGPESDAPRKESFATESLAAEVLGADTLAKDALVGDALAGDMGRCDRAQPVEDPHAYEKRVHLALHVGPFVAVDQILRDKGLRAPQIYASDLDQGLLLLESLGSAGLVHKGRPIAERYIASAETLARIHQIDWPCDIAYAPSRSHKINDFTAGILRTEAALLTDWYLTEVAGSKPTASACQEFSAIWQDLAQELEQDLTDAKGPKGRAGGIKTLVLRDFHSPNILWQPDAVGTDRIGLIDFQDALMGSPAYDLASLGQDARVTIEPDLEAAILSAYVACRRRVMIESGIGELSEVIAHPRKDAPFMPVFDEEQLRRHYAILAAQRACKILGIFARLAYRDGKSTYLQHIPRLQGYLQRTLAHPRLAALKAWCHENHVLKAF